MKNIFFIILSIWLLICIYSNAQQPFQDYNTVEAPYGQLPSVATWQKINTESGLFRAPPPGGNGNIDEGENPGGGDGEPGRNDAPVTNGIAILLILSGIYIVFKKNSVRANEISKV